MTETDKNQLIFESMDRLKEKIKTTSAPEMVETIFLDIALNVFGKALLDLYLAANEEKVDF